MTKKQTKKPVKRTATKKTTTHKKTTKPATKTLYSSKKNGVRVKEKNGNVSIEIRG